VSREDGVGAIGVLVMSYGTARGPEEVESYYTHIRGGRRPSPELLEELRERYRAIGGRSPLLEITERQVRGLEAELNDRGDARFRAYNGMKHQSPYIEDAVRAMADDGLSRAVGIVLAPHYSRMSVGQYVERAGTAARGHGLDTTFVQSYHDHPEFVSFVAGRVQEALSSLPAAVREDVPVAFSAHSLPARILAEGDPYPQQLHDTANAVAERLGLRVYLTAWQSAGRTGEEWLGPDLSVVIRRLAEAGHRAVVSCPVGFVADHLEVLFDVDIEAQQAAREAGVTLVRTRSPNDDPAFLRVLATVVGEHLAHVGWLGEPVAGAVRAGGGGDEEGS
jgi:ferrochelatase